MQLLWTCSWMTDWLQICYFAKLTVEYTCWKVMEGRLECSDMMTDIVVTDSPGVPPSATAHELFRGFSYVAPSLLDDVDHSETVVCNSQALTSVSETVVCNSQALTSFGNSCCLCLCSVLLLFHLFNHYVSHSLTKLHIDSTLAVPDDVLLLSTS